MFRPVVEKGYHIIGDFARPYHADDVRSEDLIDFPVYAVAEKNPLFPEYLRPVRFYFPDLLSHILTYRQFV